MENTLFFTRFFGMMLLTGLLGCGNQELPEVPDIGLSWELAERRKANIKDVSYNLDILVPNQLTDRLMGKNTISFTLLEVSNPIILDFKVPEDHLRSVKMHGDSIPFHFENGHIIIENQYFEKGINQITIDFDLGNQSLNRQDNFLYTLLVPDRASTAFPCFDQPNLKATFKLKLTIPKVWEALANGPLEEIRFDDTLKILTYRETRPLPTYLFDFVVGNFQKITKEVDGRQMTMLHRETDTAKVQRNEEIIFNLHGKALNWLENYTGIKMPFQKFDFALIPDFQYGGMEHPGAITYNASSLFLDENATQNQELGRASLIAHETAHMWFGNLVTMNWFDDVWMKEVFANFMAAKIVNPSFPEIDHELRFLLAHYPGAYNVDRTDGTHPIQQPLANLKDAGSLYGAIIYQKAPIVMRMLEREIGEAAMRKGLQEYLNTFAYSNATWDNLIEILDRQSPLDLNAWNQQWIKQAGMPQIQVKVIEHGPNTKIAIEITSNQRERKQIWTQQLDVAIVHKNQHFHQSVKFGATTILLNDSLTHSPQSLIIPNADGYGYGYFILDDSSKNYLLIHIHELENKIWRGVSWISLWENMLHHKIAPDVLLPALVEGIEKESDPLIQQLLLGYLGNIYWKFLPESERKAVTNQVEQRLWSVLEATKDKRYKTALFATYRSIVESQTGIQRLQAIWSENLKVNGLSLSENDFTDLAFQLAVRGVPESMAILEQQAERIINADRKARFNFIQPALSTNETVRDSFFNSLKLASNREIESWVQSALGWLHHPLRASSSEKYITPTLELLETLQSTGDIFFPKRVLDNTFAGHRSSEAVLAVKQFLADRPNYPQNLRNKILQASDETFRAAELKN